MNARQLLAASVLGIIATVHPASAQNVNPNSNVTPGTTWPEPGGTRKFLPGSGIWTYAEADLSYSCTFQSNNPQTNFMIRADILVNRHTPTTGRLTGAITPVNGSATTDHEDASRISFTPEFSEYHYIGFATNSDTEDFRVSCNETTLYGSYNTNVNNFNFLELNNITNATISGKITATNSDGTVVIDHQPFTIQKGRRSDFDLHTAAGTGKYGMVKITHDGPVGALIGAVSQYRGNAADFALSASIPLRLRDTGGN